MDFNQATVFMVPGKACSELLGKEKSCSFIIMFIFISDTFLRSFLLTATYRVHSCTVFLTVRYTVMRLLSLLPDSFTLSLLLALAQGPHTTLSIVRCADRDESKHNENPLCFP